MPKRSPEYMAAQRDRILEAAVDCFTEKGFRCTSTDEIARAAGCGKSVLYAHFPSKQDIVRALYQRLADRYPEMEAMDLANLPDYLTSAWAGLRSDRSRRMVRFSFRLAAESLDDPSLLQAQEATARRYLGWVEAAIRRDPASDGLKPRQIRDAARRLLYYTAGMQMYELFYPALGGPSQKRDLAAAASMVLAAVRAEPSPRSGRRSNQAVPSSAPRPGHSARKRK